MDTTALVVAAISAAVAIFSAIMSRRAQLAVEKRREATTAKEVLERCRGPLLDAAWLLGDRIDNMRHRNFLSFLSGDRAEDARMSTLFRFASYFGWREFLRTRVQLMRFERLEDTKLVAELLGATSLVLVSDELDESRAMLWADQQRGIGELMIEGMPDAGPVVRGSAAFRRDYEKVFAPWMSRFGDELLDPWARNSERLRLLQWALYGLVKRLDEEEVYPTMWLERTEKELAEPVADREPTHPEVEVRKYLAELSSASRGRPRR